MPLLAVLLHSSYSRFSCCWVIQTQLEIIQIHYVLSPLAFLLNLIQCVFAPQLLVKNLQYEDGKMIAASKYFSSGESSSVELTDDEKKMAEEIRASCLTHVSLE